MVLYQGSDHIHKADALVWKSRCISSSDPMKTFLVELMNGFPRWYRISAKMKLNSSWSSVARAHPSERWRPSWQGITASFLGFSGTEHMQPCHCVLLSGKGCQDSLSSKGLVTGEGHSDQRNCSQVEGHWVTIGRRVDVSVTGM